MRPKALHDVSSSPLLSSTSTGPPPAYPGGRVPSPPPPSSTSHTHSFYGANHRRHGSASASLQTYISEEVSTITVRTLVAIGLSMRPHTLYVHDVCMLIHSLLSLKYISHLDVVLRFLPFSLLPLASRCPTAQLHQSVTQHLSLLAQCAEPTALGLCPSSLSHTILPSLSQAVTQAEPCPLPELTAGLST